MPESHTHVRFIRIGEEIINLANVARVERSAVDNGQNTVLIYSTGDDRSDSRFSGEQADAVWEQFCALSEKWNVPDAERTSPAGPGRTARPT